MFIGIFNPDGSPSWLSAIQYGWSWCFSAGHDPHSHMTIIVINENGEEELWAVETTDTLRGMRQKGFAADTLKPGDEVTLVVSPAINGDRTAVFRSVEFADGTIMPAPTPRQ
jgi:hypothetical protein